MPTVATGRSSRSEKIQQAKQTLDQHLQALADELREGRSEGLLRYLEFCAQFHRYSFGNLMLALAQRPSLTRIAGVRQWNKLGRHVKKGEKGIMILAPMTVRRSRQDPGTEKAEDERGEPRTITLFKPVYVFDVCQTDGAELPSIICASGDVTQQYPALQQAVRAASIELEYAECVPGSPGALGASFGGRIVVRDNLVSVDAFRTLTHEFAHELLHWEGEKEDSHIRETEADAAAFVVCRHFGVHCDTADYLLLHDSSVKVFLERLETIRQTAARIIDAISEAQGTDNGVVG